MHIVRMAKVYDSFEIIIFALNILCVPVDIFGREKKNMVKTLHKYKYIHKLFVRTAEVPVHKFSNCIATQSISTVRQKPQHEFRLITAHLHVHTNMYICICTHFEIRAVGTRVGDTSNERLQGANVNYNYIMKCILL